MVRLRTWAQFLVPLALALLANTSEAAETPFAQSVHACESKEDWTLGARFPKDLQGEFEKSMSGSRSWAEQMISSNAAKRKGNAPEFLVLNRFWIGHAMWQAGLLHAAKRSFETALLFAPDENTQGLQIASLSCLNQIRRLAGHLTPDPKTASMLAKFQSAYFTASDRSIYLEAVSAILRAQILDEKTQTPEFETLKAALVSHGGMVHWDFLQGLIASKAQATPQAIAALERFVGAPNRPAEVLGWDEEANLLLARSHFKLGHFSSANKVYKKIDRKSNWVTDALMEMAWTHLQSGSYAGSIGIAADLLSGSLAKTFAPEASMVMAMSFVELCQYPSAFQSLQRFRQDYRETYKWLKDWDQQKGQPNYRDLYRAVNEYLKNQNSIPDPLGTEWIRSATFISRQEEINSLKQANRKIPELLKQIADLEGADAARGQGHLFEGLQRVLREAFSHNESRVAAAVTAIREDLALTNTRMLKTLSEVAQNDSLIEIEMLQGASQEMLWNQTHPEFQALVDKMENGKIEPKKMDGTWDWGRAPAATRSKEAEVWEDEMGQLRAHAENLCEKMREYKGSAKPKPKSKH